MSPPIDVSRVWVLSSGGRPEPLMEPGRGRKRGEVPPEGYWAIEGEQGPWKDIGELKEALAGGHAPGAIRLRRPAAGDADDAGRRAG